MADVVKVEHGNGDVSIGVEVDGTYIPLAQASAAKIAGLQERAAGLAERYEADPDDKAVAEALHAHPSSVKPLGSAKGEASDEANGEGA